MNNLEQLTASREICDALVELGIHEIAFMWWLKDADSDAWEVCLVEQPEPFPGMCVPAWTKQELDAMIGPNMPKPDVYTTEEMGNNKLEVSRAKLKGAQNRLAALIKEKASAHDIRVAGDYVAEVKREVDGHLRDLLQYPIFTPERLYIHKNGAEASAFVLKILLERGEVKADDCMTRYNMMFKPAV